MTNILDQISTGVQIVFFSVTGCAAILTYVAAKRTLFQPLRAEVFKRQIDDLSSVLRLFSGKGEVALRDQFSFKTFIRVNIMHMYDDYASFAFEITRPEESREYSHELCPSSMMLPEVLELADSYITEDKPVKREKPKSWDYKGYETHIPRAFSAKEDEFRRILDSPLLPKSVAAMLEHYLSAVQNNVHEVRLVIVECSKEMGEKYPTIEALEKAKYDWISARISTKLVRLEPEARKINEYVRAYFDSDNLLPVKNNKKGVNFLRLPSSR